MRNIFLALLLTSTLPCYSQVAFQTISYTDALNKAQAEGKMIFLQLESPTCKQCTEVAEKGLSDNKVSDRINQAFIPLYVTAKHKDRKEIEFLFNTPDGFGTLFIDQSGTLLHKFSRTTSMSKDYLDQIDIAFHKAGETLKVSELEREYRNGNKSIGFLEQLLLKKRELNMDYVALLDEYVSLLPADSLSSIYTLQFMADMAPLLGSKADYALRNNRSLFTLAWNMIPSAKRININSRIIHVSMRKAVREKDERFALRIASFAKGTSTVNKANGERAYGMRMIDFYERTGNPAKYFQTAIQLFDNYYMTVDIDSVKKFDDAKVEQLLQSGPKDTIRNDKGYTVTTTINYTATAQKFTKDLKAGAHFFYDHTNDPALLAKATAWIKKGIAFYESYDALEVYALLLYKQGQKEEAIQLEKKAIALKKKVGITTKDNEAILSQMEKGLPLES